MFTAAVITVSDLCAAGKREDTSGPAICDLLEQADYKVIHTATVPDEWAGIEKALRHSCDELGASLVVTTGGTGFSPRDITPEVTLSVVEREVRGIPEAMRMASMAITPRGCLSRAAAGIRGRSLIVNVPGSKKAAVENLQAVLEPLGHGLEMLASSGSANCGG